ncbi:MAG: hypothetical protein IPN17_24575 [Deltaproteobacteria bacterium]|nr:hypothetical protein [Deltaproteobacteria bacterium]
MHRDTAEANARRDRVQRGAPLLLAGARMEAEDLVTEDHDEDRREGLIGAHPARLSRIKAARGGRKTARDRRPFRFHTTASQRSTSWYTSTEKIARRGSRSGMPNTPLRAPRSHRSDRRRGSPSDRDEAYEQPAGPLVVPPPQVRAALPDTVHAPLQVMAQVPDAQFTVEPAPTVWVQLAPLHSTRHSGPQLPEQVDPEAQLKLQPLVELEQVSKAQVSPAGHAHDEPEQTLDPQLATTSDRTNEAHRTPKRTMETSR